MRLVRSTHSSFGPPPGEVPSSLVKRRDLVRHLGRKKARSTNSASTTGCLAPMSVHKRAKIRPEFIAGRRSQWGKMQLPIAFPLTLSRLADRCTGAA